MRIRPLPPMKSLIVFEAAARHLSFTKAANELHVTQGAISRQIRQLEDYLGKELFVRANRSIMLTPTGVQYYQIIYKSLLNIAQTTAEIKKWQGDSQVTVVTTNAMASLWLLPRVARFEREEIDLRILTTENIADLERMDFDLALFYCKNPPKDMEATPLFSEEVFPVCSPSYLARIQDSHKPENIFSRTLLYLDDSHKDWLTWPEWFAAVGLPVVKPKNRININNYPLLLQTAISGQGVAMAWGALVDDYLKNGMLVRPVDTVLRTEAKFCLLEPVGRGIVSASVKYFKNWVLEQLPSA